MRDVVQVLYIWSDIYLATTAWMLNMSAELTFPAEDSGVNENVTSQFPGSTVQVGGTKRGENPTIPVEEGGEEANKVTGRYVSFRSLNFVVQRVEMH
jgi:hypothetical protein